MALTQIGKEGITGISNSANANAITIDSGENVALSGTLGVTGAITGTLATAAQTNITSVGTLTSFRSTGIDDNADALAITIDGSERVMIGTTTEGYSSADDLTIATTGHTGITIRSSASHEGAIFFSDATSGTGEYAGYIQYNHSNDSLILASNASERMRIDSIGRVQIGTSNVATTDSMLTLQKSSTAVEFNIISSPSHASVINLGDTGDYNITRIKGDNSTNSLQFQTNNAERMRIDADGNVGIGTTSPEAQTHLAKAVSAGSDNLALRIQNPTNAADARVGIAFHVNAVTGSGWDGAFIQSANSGSDNGDLRFGSVTNNTLSERMRINSSGNAGIGTSSPNSRLEVRNDTNANTTLMLSSQIQTAGNYHEFALGVETFYAVGLRRTLTQSTPTYLRPRLDFFVQNYNTYEAGDRSVKMSLNDTGRLGLNTTNPDAGSMMTIVHPGSSVYGLRLQTSQTSGTQYHLTVYRNTTHAGYLTSNAALQVALYNASDERLKENIVESESATQSVKNMKVRQYNWKSDKDTTVKYGFVAQELVTEAPEAVIEGTDEKDDNDNYKQSWSVSYNNLVPRLVKTIQELEARITELENK